MPKSRLKIKKSIIASATTIIGLTEELESTLCCSQRNCPSHWQNRLGEKLKILQQTKLKAASNKCQSTSNVHSTTKSKTKQRCRRLLHPEILSQLFIMNVESTAEQNEEIYSDPIAKSIVLEKHETFAKQIEMTFGTNDSSSFSFTKTNLQAQLQYRMISLVADPFSDQMDRMETSTQLKINLLRINHVHWKCRLPLKIISTAIWTKSAVHVVVQDENSDCLRLSIYNWSHVVNTRQIKSYNYVQQRLTNLLPMNSCIVLLDPWLKRCHDGQIGLRCESPNTHLLMIDFETRCSTSERTNVDQLRQWGNSCYQADDNLAAIEFYTFGLRQIDEQQEKDSNSNSNDERQQHRIRLLSNRCACYLRERHATLALADTSVLLSLDELSNVLESSQTTTGKLLFRCLSAHLHLGLFEKAENLLKSHQLGLSFVGGENSASIAILERELIRLKDESVRGRYDLQGMLKEQILINTHEKSALMFIDLPHYHAECHRNDLFEVRPCTTDEINKHRYPTGSYGVFALKNIDSGTLIVVEQPFASVDNRTSAEFYCHSMNFLQRNEKLSTVEYFDDEMLRLINEMEKQLLIGNASWMTFEKLKLIQPIRQWLAENSQNSTSEDLSKHWQKNFPDGRIPTSTFIPWRILFESEQQNPFRSQSVRGCYPLGSMFNHSCLPNCLWYLIGDCLFIFVCGSNIRQGDELTISYCPMWISSLNERTNNLRQFGIHSCRCSLCSYDRSNMPQYEIELRKFFNLRALSRQEDLPRNKRFHYVQKSKEIFESITKKYKQRPIGFVREFLDFETISNYFQTNFIPMTESEQENEDQIQEYSHDRELSFLIRLSRVCRFTIKDLPKISNPMFLFGKQMQLLVEHLENYSTRIHSCDLKQWNRLLECLYEIYTFKCHSSSSDMQKTLKDHEQLFNNLCQTQSIFH